MAGEKSKLHQAAGDIFWKIEPVEDSGFTRLQVGQRLGSNWGIPPIRIPVDTQLHREISIRLHPKQVKFLEKQSQNTSRMIIPDHFGPRCKIRKEYFFIILLDKYALRFYTLYRVK